MEEIEFEQHMRDTFAPSHYEKGAFVYSTDALIRGLNTISYDTFEIEMHLDEEAPYFKGKLTIIEALRKTQALATMLSVAVDRSENDR